MSPSTKRKATFTFIDAPGKKVFVAGSFNKWNPTASPLAYCEKSGVYSATLWIPRGKHEYKFVVDDIWQADPANPDFVINVHGSLNSFVIV